MTSTSTCRRLRILVIAASAAVMLGGALEASASDAPPTTAELHQQCSFDETRALWEVDWTFTATAADQPRVLWRHIDGNEPFELLTVAAGEPIARTDRLSHTGYAYSGQFELRDSAGQILEAWRFMECLSRDPSAGSAPPDPARHTAVREKCALTPRSGTGGPSSWPVRRPGFDLDMRAGTHALAVYLQQVLVKVIQPGESLTTSIWAELDGEQGAVDNAFLTGNWARVDGGLVILALSGGAENNTLVMAVEHPGCSQLVTVTPARLMDTRTGQPTVDGLSAGIGLRGAGTVTELTVTGRGDVPTPDPLSKDSVTPPLAVWLSVVATDVRDPGYVTVFPCGTTPPRASNLNFDRGAQSPTPSSRLPTRQAGCASTPRLPPTWWSM